MLDEFKSAGVFVNWWQHIRYDLKTIVLMGWHHTLVPDEYLITAFFQSDKDVIDKLESRIGELQAQLGEAVESAQEVAAYEPDDSKKVTAAVIKKVLKVLINDLKNSAGASAQRELDGLQARDVAVKKIEKKIRDSRSALKGKTRELEFKVRLKRLGGEGFKTESRELIQQVESRLVKLDSSNRTDKRKINALNKDKAALEQRIARINTVLQEINGQMTDEESKHLILTKLYDIADTELERYLKAEMRQLVSGVENLWSKYAVSTQTMEQARVQIVDRLDGFLRALGYFGGQT